MKIADIGNSELDFRQTGEARLQEICSRFGLENASYAHIDKYHNVVHGCTTFPAEWVRHYVDNDLVLADPLIRFGAAMIAPIDWAVFDDQREHAPLFEAAREFGVGQNGLSIPVINPFGERGVFTVTSNLTRADWDALVAKMLPALRHEAQVLHLLALDVIDTVFQLLNNTRELFHVGVYVCFKLLYSFYGLVLLVESFFNLIIRSHIVSMDLLMSCRVLLKLLRELIELGV